MPETPPTIQINNPPNPNSQDHDLLIQIDTKLGRALADIQKLGTDMNNIADNKVSERDFDDYKTEREKDFTDYKKTIKEQLDDQEQRLRFLTKIVQYGLGAIAAVELALVIYQTFNH